MAILSQVSKSPPAILRSKIPAGACLWTGALVTVVVLGLLAMGSAQAIDIPALPVVPPNIAATNPALVKQREVLLKERKALLDRTNSHNQLCSAVEVGSAAEASCTKAYPALEQAINSHIQASKQYNDDHLAAVNLAASLKPAPNADTSVVDARNVPSGLPKALDNAIASAYSSAPPGVSERVRKGFQAVMIRDWKVAKAWFQDALNRDPDNVGLKRLIALTDSSLQPNQRPATVDVRNEPVGLGGKSDMKGSSAPQGKTKPAQATGTQLQLPDPNDIRFLFPGLEATTDPNMQLPSMDDILFLFPVLIPQDSDMELLYDLNEQPPAKKSRKAK